MMSNEWSKRGVAVRAWWQALPSRQRYVSIGAVGVILALALWIWVWEPLRDARDRARAQVAEQQALAGWLRAVVPATSELRRNSGGAVVQADDRSLLGIVDETARTAGLAAAIGRIEPAGERQVRIWLNDAGFAILMGWLERLATEQGIQVRELTAERSAQTGAVNARITLGRDA